VRDWRPSFIKSIRDGRTVRDSAELAGVARDTPYKRRMRGDRYFAEQWEQAKRDASAPPTAA
jgi:hypothetical protein